MTREERRRMAHWAKNVTQNLRDEFAASGPLSPCIDEMVHAAIQNAFKDGVWSTEERIERCLNR